MSQRVGRYGSARKSVIKDGIISDLDMNAASERFDDYETFARFLTKLYVDLVFRTRFCEDSSRVEIDRLEADHGEFAKRFYAERGW